jgi:putative FmdB family regulatory protein
MPSYGYICTKCKKEFRDLNSISARNESECECGGIAKRDMEVECKLAGSFKLVSENERWSLAAGVPASQVGEFRKRFPDSVYRDDGRLLIKSRKHKLQEMKKRNMIELGDRK